MSKFTKALEQAERDRRSRLQASGIPGLGGAPPLGSASEVTGPWALSEGAPAAHVDEIALDRLEETLARLMDPTAFALEQYRTLRNVIEGAAPGGDPYVVAVSSPAAGDGKSVTSVNLAGALAQSPGARVLLVEADLRAVSLAQKLGLDPAARPGLADAVRDRALPLREVTRYSPQLNLALILAGRTAAVPAYELLRAPRFAEILGEARRAYHYVVLDTPPLVPPTAG